MPHHLNKAAGFVLSGHFTGISPYSLREVKSVLLGLSRMEGLRGRDWSGVGAGTGTPFRDKPPPPQLSRMGALRAGSSISAPLRDNRGGGGGGACLERVC